MSQIFIVCMIFVCCGFTNFRNSTNLLLSFTLSVVGMTWLCVCVHVYVCTCTELDVKDCSPMCKNGGTCDMVTGLCVCPPGLTGADCGKQLLMCSCLGTCAIHAGMC